MVGIMSQGKVKLQMESPVCGVTTTLESWLSIFRKLFMMSNTTSSQIVLKNNLLLLINDRFL